MSRAPVFEVFFEEHYARVLRSVRLVVTDRDHAEERVQEAFARAYRRWARVSQMERPVTWVYVVALNAERRQWRRGPPEAVLVESDLSLPDLARSVTTTIVVREALDRLTDRQRTMVVLRYFSDLKLSEVAEVMGCAEGTVKATLHRALRILRLEMEDDPS